MGGKRIWKALKWFSRPIERLRMGERQGVEGEIRQQERKFINLKNLRYIKKQNKITITKEMTKHKGKGKKKEEEKKRRKQVPPGIELRTFCTPGCFITTTPRETHCQDVDNTLLKAFSLELLPVYPVNVFCYLDFHSYLKANYPKSLPFALKSAFAFKIHCKKHSATLKTTAKRPSTLVTDLMGNRFQSNVA